MCLVLFVAHSHSVSLSQRHIQRCLSVSEKIMLIKEPSSSNTVIVRWWEGGQLTRSLVFFVVLFACFVVAVLSVHSRLPLSRLLFFSPPAVVHTVLLFIVWNQIHEVNFKLYITCLSRLKQWLNYLFHTINYYYFMSFHKLTANLIRYTTLILWGTDSTICQKHSSTLYHHTFSADLSMMQMFQNSPNVLC